MSSTSSSAEARREEKHDDEINKDMRRSIDISDGDAEAEKDSFSDDKEKGYAIDKPYYHSLTPSKKLPACPGDHRDYHVEWLGPDDPGNPLNWGTFKKLRTIFFCSLTATVAAFGSAAVSASTDEIMEVFHIGLSVAELNTSLFVLGFALGPVIWGPLSEQMGRRLPQILGMVGLAVFSFGGGAGKDYQTLVITRFFAGVFGSSAFSISPAVAADLFTAKNRGRAVAVVSLTICAGPMIAPVVGGYIVNSYLHWRWTFYITGIFTSLALCGVVFLMPESYAPKLLAERAREIREETGNWSISAPLEHTKLDASNVVEQTIIKPLKMLAVEPILLLLSIYNGFIYGILYLCLSAIPLIFASYGWHGGNIFLPYLGMFAGAVVVIVLNLAITEVSYRRKLERVGPSGMTPEDRLPMMMVSGVVYIMGIFLLCWSGAYRVFWFVPTLGCAFIGFGTIGIFMPTFSYIIDSYLMLAASAIAGLTFVRSLMGCAFPLFATQMFRNLGIQWAGTLLGCLAALLVPVPFLFYIYGKRIRQKSLYAFDKEALELKLAKKPTSDANP